MSRPRIVALFALGFLVWVMPRAGQAQYYGTTFVPGGSVNFGGMNFGATNFGATNFGATNFGAVNFGATNFGAVNFGAVNFTPGGGYGYANGYDGAYGVAPGVLGGFSPAQAKYNMANANATPAAAANAMVGRRSLETFLAENPDAAGPGAGRYNIRNARRRGANPGGTRLIDMTGRDGSVRWPANAPIQGDLAQKRADADEVVRAALQRFRSSGNASVEQINAALGGVVAYANPAMDYLRDQNPDQLFAFRDFVVNLDNALRRLTGDNLDAPALNNAPAPD